MGRVKFQREIYEGVRSIKVDERGSVYLSYEEGYPGESFQLIRGWRSRIKVEGKIITKYLECAEDVTFIGDIDCGVVNSLFINKSGLPALIPTGIRTIRRNETISEYLKGRQLRYKRTDYIGGSSNYTILHLDGEFESIHLNYVARNQLLKVRINLKGSSSFVKCAKDLMLKGSIHKVVMPSESTINVYS